MRRTALVQAVDREAKRSLPRALKKPHTFGHGDFHPGNLLWHRGLLSGVIDWSHAISAPATHDVSYMRSDLAVLLGCRASDRFLEWYERLGGTVADLRVWDLTRGLSAIRWCPWWVVPYREQGATWLTESLAKQRARAFVRRALG
jgi:aminoglycoside phosphotransferase (APT) family kinase protein